MRQSLVMGVITLVLMNSIGCGSNGFHSVEGLVTLEGKPIDGAVVSFSPKVPKVGSAAVGTTDKEGRFTLAPLTIGSAAVGAAEGVYSVSISKAEADLGVWDIPTDAVASAPKTVDVKSSLSLAYANAATSGLTAEVKPGKNKFEFDLKKDFGSKKK
jgi:hypothetical protein